MLPLSALAIVLCRPLVYFVFTHTRLNQEDFQSTAVALAFFGVGMFARSALHLVSRGFNAIHDTLTPAWIGTLLTLLSLPIYWFCARTWQYVGLAAASSAVAIVLVSILFVSLVRRTRSEEWRNILACLVRVLVSSVLGAVACSSLAQWLELRIRWQTFAGALLILIAVTAVGIPLILFIAHILGVTEIENYLAKLIPGVRAKAPLGQE
jgi:putative peptidoglycan lipid II flippase